MTELQADPVPPVHDAPVVAGRHVVVVIGIDHYAAWHHLGNAVNDARGTADAFRRLGFAEHPGLFDGDATRDALHALVTDDLRSLGVNDSLVVFFAGHGASVPQILDGTEVNTGYLIPVDAENREGRVASWIRLDHWLADLARLPPRHILVIIDACHGGVALDAIRTRGVAPAAARTRDVLAAAEDAASPPALRLSRQVIVSALAGQLALDGGPTPGHSLFTGCLLEALHHGLRRGGDPTASGSEIGVYLQKQLARYPDARQTPGIRRFDFDDGGELTVPLARVASGTEPILLGADANARLRDRLAAALADQFSSRAAIADVIRAAAPQIAVADLPVGGGAMIWGYVLAELTHAGAFSEIAALVAAARERSWRSRRFDWSVFRALHEPRAKPAVASWSHLEVDILRDSEQAGRTESTLITRGQTLLEADVTQRWGGARPQPPRIEVTSNQLFGTRLQPLHQITQLASPELTVARWRVQIPVPAARLRTRWVTVQCAGTDASARRYIVARRGSLCAGALWLACAGFATWWLYWISHVLTLLPLVAVGLVLGVLPPVVMHLLWRVTGRRSFRRILYAWELAAPLGVLAATLVIVLPPHLVKLVTNDTDETVPLGDGAMLPPHAERRAVWAWHVIPPPVRPLCTCGESHCSCERLSPVHGVDQVTFGCFGGDCKKDTDFVTYRGKTLEVTRTKGVAVSPLQFRANAASSRMTLTVDGFSAEARDVPPANDDTLELRMLPAGAPYNLEFIDGETPRGTLHCDVGAALIVPIDLALDSRDREPEDPKVGISIGKVHSTWTGALAQIRACSHPADRDGLRMLHVEPHSEQGVTCRLGSKERVVALDAAALAPGRSLPAAELQLGRACLGRAGSLELAGMAQGVEAKLPAALPFAHLRVRLPGAAGTLVETACVPDQTLRAVKLEVSDRPRFELGGVRVVRIDGATGVTCDAPRVVSDAKRRCELTQTALTCAAIPPPRPLPRVVDCSIDKSSYPHWSRTCDPCLPEVLTDDLKEAAARDGFSCRSLCRCE